MLQKYMYHFGLMGKEGLAVTLFSIHRIILQGLKVLAGRDAERLQPQLQMMALSVLQSMNKEDKENGGQLIPPTALTRAPPRKSVMCLGLILLLRAAPNASRAGKSVHVVSVCLFLNFHFISCGLLVFFFFCFALLCKSSSYLTCNI